MIKRIRGSSRNVKYSRSASQIKRNRAYRTCCTWWRQNWTPERILLWINFAPENNSGFNAFLSVNVVRVYNDLPVQPDPPPEV